MKVKILEESREYDGFFKLDKAVLQYEKFNGEMSGKVTRLNFDRGDAVAVLLYDDESDCVTLVKQFRYPVYVNDDPGWILEVVAGIVDKGRDPESVARAELMEEAGCEVEELEFIGKFYPSPGGCSERIYLYMGHGNRKVSTGGGKPDEGEDIRVLEIPFEEAMRMVDTGEICNATTIIALQWLKLSKLFKGDI